MTDADESLTPVEVAPPWVHEMDQYFAQQMLGVEVKEIGVIGVDSGQIIILDPCLLRPIKGREIRPANGISEDRAFFAIESHYDNGDGDTGTVDVGIQITTPLGDGGYPVIATLNKFGQIIKIEITFV